MGIHPTNPLVLILYYAIYILPLTVPVGMCGLLLFGLPLIPLIRYRTLIWSPSVYACLAIASGMIPAMLLLGIFCWILPSPPVLIVAGPLTIVGGGYIGFLLGWSIWNGQLEAAR